jgi:phenylacetate-CoA ligase
MRNLKSLFIEKFVFKIGDLLMGTEVLKQIKSHRRYTFLKQEELKKIQEKKLYDMLNHATKTCKFYEQYYKNDVNSYEWIKQFPVINKQHTNSSTKELLSYKFKFSKLIKYETSGSSGIRAIVYVDKKEQSKFRAILINWWEWNGYNIGNTLLQTGMSPDRGFIKSIKDFLLSTIYVNAFGLTEEEAVFKLNKAKKYKNCTLFGYASSLYTLALIAEKNEINLSFKLAMSQGDKLFEHYKIKIEQVFNCKVVEDYGLNEGIMIGQKKDLPYYYYYQPSVFIEILDDNNNPVKDGEMGRIIATKLDGYAMPLIRYDTGDLGVMLPIEKYPQKRDLDFKLIETVIGRNTDIIKTNDGKTLIVHTFTGIFEFFPQVKQFQVVQKKLDSLIFKFIAAENFESNTLIYIEKLFRERTKSDIEIIWQQVEIIEPSKSGKPQLVINELLKNSLTNQV